MELKLDIGVEQLPRLIRQLPAKQRAQVKAMLDGPKGGTPKRDKALEELLLAGPTLSKAELDRMAEAREAIDQWRSR